MAGDHADRPLVCVLGEMGELGSLSEDEHRNLGRLVADIKPRLVCWKGGHLEEFEDGLHAGRYGGAFCPVTSAEDMFKGLAACDLGSGGGRDPVQGITFEQIGNVGQRLYGGTGGRTPCCITCCIR